jgi:hypothetical protein
MCSAAFAIGYEFDDGAPLPPSKLPLFLRSLKPSFLGSIMNLSFRIPGYSAFGDRVDRMISYVNLYIIFQIGNCSK